MLKIYQLKFEEETKPELEGFEKGQVSELGAVNVMTGIYTGRSPKDKYIVMDENSKDTVWWTTDEYKNDNHPATQEAWNAVKEIAKKELSNKRLFVVDAFCGANKDTRMAIRFIVEVAWQAHFVTNMFIQPTAEELENFEPDFVVYNASKAKVENYKELGLNSETAVMFNITTKEQVFAVHICVCRAVHGSHAFQWKEVVHHREHTFLHFSAVPCVYDNLLCKHRYERRKHSYLLRSFRNR